MPQATLLFFACPIFLAASSCRYEVGPIVVAPSNREGKFALKYFRTDGSRSKRLNDRGPKLR